MSLQLVKPEPARPWERLEGETEIAFAAFTVYRDLGLQRSLAKVAKALGKSVPLMEGWSSRHCWAVRVLAWDRYQSRVVNDRVMRGTAAMRERQVIASMHMQARVQKRLMALSDMDIACMRPIDVCAVMRMASEMERQAREIPKGDEWLPEALQPAFEMTTVTVHPTGSGMVAVELNGRYGWLPYSSVERFRAENPQATILTSR